MHGRGTLALVVAGVFAGLAAPVAAQRIPDQRIDSGTQYDLARARLAAVGSAVYLVWQDTRNGRSDIYFNRSLDGGSTWLVADVRLNTYTGADGFATAPQITAVGSSVYVTWIDGRPGQGGVAFNRSLDGGATWLASDVRLSTAALPFNTANPPEIAAAGAAVYVVWSDVRHGAADIYANRSLDGGATWLPAEVRLDAGSSAGSAISEHPRIATSGASVFVTWTDLREQRPDIYLSRSLDGGTTWQHEVRLDTGDGASHDPEIATSGSAVYVVWSDARDGSWEVYGNRSLDGGATWLGADVRLNRASTRQPAAHRPALAVSGDDVFVAWIDGRDGGADLYGNRSRNRGTSWLPADVAIAAATAASVPRLVASGADVFAVWEDRRAGLLPDAYFSRSADAGATWLANRRLGTSHPPGSVVSREPQIAVSGDGVYVAWSNDPGSHGGVRFNIPFGFHAYEAGKAGAGGIVPRLAGAGRPTLGRTVSLEVTGGPGGAAGILLLAGPQSRLAVPAFGGLLLVWPQACVPFVLGGPLGVPGAGSASLPLAIPPAAAGIGVSVNAQAWIVDPTATFFLSNSNGVEIWIG